MRIFVSILLVSSLLALGACNTADGLGRDVEKAGEKIQQAF